MPPGRTNMAKIGIIGAGTWGIALSVLLHDNGHKISVWSALPQEIKDLQEKHEHKNLPGVVLPEDMEFTADLGTRRIFWYWQFPLFLPEVLLMP